MEVLLALAISVMLIAAIGWAIRVYLLNLNETQTRLERAQVARGVIQMVSNDLRAAIQYKPADVSGLEDLMSSQSAAGLLGGLSQDQTDQLEESGVDPSALGGGGETGGTDPSAGMDPSAGAGPAGAPNPATSTSSAAPPDRPGLYGTATEILIDISRLPRVDQYNPLVASGGAEMNALPTDIKTVGYYVIPAGTGNAGNAGLYRRSMDRAIANFAMSNGGSLGDGNNQLIAPEVVEISFRYFDGEEWATEWDSDEMGGFPLAVEFVFSIDPARSYDPEDAAAIQAIGNEDIIIHRTVVHLPLAELSEEDSSGGSMGGMQ